MNRREFIKTAMMGAVALAIPTELVAAPPKTITLDIYDQYGTTVYIDYENGVAGTKWPIGTPNFPVNNWTDAQMIMVRNQCGLGRPLNT